MSVQRKRARSLAVGLVSLLVVLLGWWLWPRHEPAIVGAPKDARDTDRATHSGGVYGGVGARPFDPAGDPEASAQIVGGVVVEPESGPLAEGRIDLVCEDQRVAARLPLTEDGQFAGPACDGVTCARLVHPTFEQPQAWVLEPGATRELEVARAPGLVGRVVAGGERVPNASLLLRQAGARVSGSTDADGEFSLSLPAIRPCDPCDPSSEDEAPSCRPAEQPDGDGSANVLVWADGHAPRELEVKLDVEHPIELELLPAAAPISGRVLGSDGQPLGERTVVLATNIEDDAEQHAANVEIDGRFVLDDLAEAEYRLRVVRDGVELATLERASAGQEVELRADVTARFVTVEIEVLDARGRVAVGVRVDGGPLRGAVTDAEGHVRAEEVLPGRYPLRIRAPSCPVVRADLQIDPELGATQRQAVHLTDCSLGAP